MIGKRNTSRWQALALSNAATIWIAVVAGAVSVGCLGLIAAGDVRAQEPKVETPESWQRVLAVQLKEQNGCVLDKVLFDRDIEAGGQKAKEGRVRCLDGREFDFSRDAKHEKFNIRLCLPTVC